MNEMIEKLNDVADLLFSLYEDESDKESKNVRKQQFDTVIDAMQTIQHQQAEIERLKNAMVETGSIHCPCSPDCGDDCEKCVDSAIDETLKAERRWIPVSERLPKREQIPFDCLVALKSGTVHEATFLDVDPVHRWCTELHYFNMGDVIAWMPLPQPPKEGR